MSRLGPLAMAVAAVAGVAGLAVGAPESGPGSIPKPDRTRDCLPAALAMVAQPCIELPVESPGPDGSPEPAASASPSSTEEPESDGGAEAIVFGGMGSFRNGRSDDCDAETGTGVMPPAYDMKVDVSMSDENVLTFVQYTPNGRTWAPLTGPVDDDGTFAFTTSDDQGGFALDGRIGSAALNATWTWTTDWGTGPCSITWDVVVPRR